MYNMIAEDDGGMDQLRRGVAEYCVLAVLKGDEHYGFDLARKLAELRIVASEGTIYPLLARLRREGLVSTQWRESALGPPRRYYILTTAGDQVLQQFRERWRIFREIVDSLLGTK